LAENSNNNEKADFLFIGQKSEHLCFLPVTDPVQSRTCAGVDWGYLWSYVLLTYGWSDQPYRSYYATKMT